MLTNADITLYNYWYNPEGKEYEYRRTQIEGVNWYADQKVSATDKGLVSADLYKIRIPDHAKAQDGRRYINCDEYRSLQPEEVDKFWTVANDEIVVKGLIEDDIASLNDLRQYSEKARIRSFYVNSFGKNPHIRIGGVA